MTCFQCVLVVYGLVLKQILGSHALN